MKIVIPLAGFGTRMRPHTWSRPKPLLHVAGDTVIGHLLKQMADVTDHEIIFVVGYKGSDIETWIRKHHGNLNAQFVVQDQALGQAHAIWLCREYLDDDDVLVAFGDGIVQADYRALGDSDADGLLVVQEVDDPRKFGVVALDENGVVQALIEKPSTMEHKLAMVGVYWFRSGVMLRDALDTVIAEQRMTKGEYYLADAYQVLLEQNARIKTVRAGFWLDAGNPENILQTNARLLEHLNGHNTAGSGDGASITNPVFIHPSANIESSVVGPDVSIGEGVSIRNCVIRNSIIDSGASLSNVVLDGALIGENASVSGQGQRLFIGDNALLTL